MTTHAAPEATPIPGQPYRIGTTPEVIIPIYVPELSEAPDHRNGCLTARYAAEWGKADTFAPTGWFVYYSYPGGSTDRADYRRFVPFGQLVPEGQVVALDA